LVLILIAALFVFLMYFIYIKSSNQQIPSFNEINISPYDKDETEKDETTKDENVEELELRIKKLSLLLNQASNKIGRLSCQLSDDVSENGGWCSKISGKNSPQHATDFALARELSNYLKGKRVASFGDGPGK
jgi:hypothetical protein